MPFSNREAIKKFILNHVAERSHARLPNNVPDSFDLLEHGIIDSLGLVDLIAAVEAGSGVEIDLSAVPLEELTVVGALVTCIDKAIVEARARDPVGVSSRR
jgi:acyl carrier protein